MQSLLLSVQLINEGQCVVKVSPSVVVFAIHEWNPDVCVPLPFWWCQWPHWTGSEDSALHHSQCYRTPPLHRPRGTETTQTQRMLESAQLHLKQAKSPNRTDHFWTLSFSSNTWLHSASARKSGEQLFLPLPPTSHRWGHPAPTSLLLWCRRYQSGLLEPKILEFRKMCWSGPRSPFLQRFEVELLEKKNKKKAWQIKIQSVQKVVILHLLYTVQSQRSSRIRLCPVAGCLAWGLWKIDVQMQAGMKTILWV